MFIRTIKKKANGKVYITRYLAESYRDENGKVKHRHLVNLSKFPPEVIKAIEIALKTGKIHNINQLRFRVKQGKSVGAIKVIKTIAKRLGIS